MFFINITFVTKQAKGIVSTQLLSPHKILQGPIRPRLTRAPGASENHQTMTSRRSRSKSVCGK